MDSLSAVRAMLEAAGVTPYRVSIDAGKSAGWLGAALAQSSRLSVDTVTIAAEICGYELALVPAADLPSSALVIDAPAAEEPSR